jgi:hypothetical protein
MKKTIRAWAVFTKAGRMLFPTTADDEAWSVYRAKADLGLDYETFKRRGYRVRSITITYDDGKPGREDQ